MKIYFIIALLVLSLTTNVVLLYRVIRYQPISAANIESARLPLVDSSSTVVNDSNTNNNELILHYGQLKPQLDKMIGSYGSNKKIGIFLQDIKTGAWYGVNEKQGFMPASLLKVPIMMVTLKRVSRDEIKLTDTIELKTEDLDSGTGNLYKQGAGAKLSYWDLMKIMILSSDNTAKNALKRQLMPVELNAVFAHIGINNPYESSDNTVTPRGYSRIFKSLYFSTFLPPQLSEKALDLTTDTQVENLISAGIPPDIQVAHKYGERPDGFSDCGIVYLPKNPYYLCIMTKDIELHEAKDLITNLSKTIYDFVSTH